MRTEGDEDEELAARVHLLLLSARSGRRSLSTAATLAQRRLAFACSLPSALELLVGEAACRPDLIALVGQAA